MGDWLDKLRNKSVQERQYAALVGAGAIIGAVFLIWAAVNVSKIDNASAVITEVEGTDNKASVIDGAKRKIDLLFGDLDSFRDIGKPIEYKQEDADEIEKQVEM